jgi:hypothetical protein
MESRTSEGRLGAHERKLRALELRKEGRSFPAIAELLGYAGPSGAYRAVTRSVRSAWASTSSPAVCMTAIGWY